MLLSRSLRFYKDVLLWNPLRAIAIITIRCEKRIGVSTHWLFPSRRIVRAFEKKQLPLLSAADVAIYGNYVLHKNKALTIESIVYSCGVGQDLLFDEAVHAAHGCPVYLFDPTPASIRFMESNTAAHFHFHPWAVSDADAVLTLHADRHADTNLSESFSIHARSPYAAATIEVEAYTLHTLMQKLGHDRIDVLKMDIEGAAEGALLHLLEQNVYPEQIVCEFEAPRNHAETDACCARLANIFEKLKRLDYDVYRITNCAYGARIEMLACKK